MRSLFCSGGTSSWMICHMRAGSRHPCRPARVPWEKRLACRSGGSRRRERGSCRPGSLSMFGISRTSTGLRAASANEAREVVARRPPPPEGSGRRARRRAPGEMAREDRAQCRVSQGQAPAPPGCRMWRAPSRHLPSPVLLLSPAWDRGVRLAPARRALVRVFGSVSALGEHNRRRRTPPARMGAAPIAHGMRWAAHPALVPCDAVFVPDADLCVAFAGTQCLACHDARQRRAPRGSGGRSSNAGDSSRRYGACPQDGRPVRAGRRHMEPQADARG